MGGDTLREKKQRSLLPAIVLAALVLTACGGGAPAEEQPLPSPAVTETPPLPQLEISELMSNNAATLSDGEGNFPDWVELRSAAPEAMDLNGFVLESGDEVWALPEQTLDPGEFCLFPLSSGLSKNGDSLRLRSPDGRLIQELAFPALEKDESWQLQPDGSWVLSRFPSPGRENTEEGYLRFQESLAVPADGLAIWEAMTYNEWYLEQWEWVGGSQEKSCHDWVELRNLGQEPIELSNYYLSDKNKDRLLYRLPEQQLEPGACAIVLCGSEELGAPFSLSGDGEQLYLSRADGTLCDYAALHDIPFGMSQGRREGQGGFFYIPAPSPGEDNGEGARLRAEKPAAAEADGVFEDVKEVLVTLSGAGEIHYTLDGSKPTAESSRYEKPIRVTETTVLRAACFRPERLPSEILTLSYILNEHHTLPVVSLTCDPEDFSGRRGIYSHPQEDWEVQANVALFDGEDSFDLDCGLKIHGATSRIVQKKKSYKLNFRTRYAGTLHYDLFENGVTDFSSILLRSDQEGDVPTFMRDNLMHQIARDNLPALSVQDGRWAILYLNGEYWGIYSLREAHSEEHYANHNGLDPETVVHWKELWPKYSIPDEVYQFAVRNDMSRQENYEQVAAHLDLDSIIAWGIMEAYSGNFDYNSPNMRFYWTEEDQKLHYALVDLDFGFYDHGNFYDVFGYKYAYDALPGQLLKNPQFVDELLTQTNRMLTGPLSDEEVIRRIDEAEEILRPEIERDSLRWGKNPKAWPSVVQSLRNFVLYDGGRAKLMVKWLSMSLRLSAEQTEKYFPWYFAE